jgi:hypothetical protein
MARDVDFEIIMSFTFFDQCVKSKKTCRTEREKDKGIPLIYILQRKLRKVHSRTGHKCSEMK